MLCGREIAIPLLDIKHQFHSPAYSLVTLLIRVLCVRIVNFHLEIGCCFISEHVADRIELYSCTTVTDILIIHFVLKFKHMIVL
jgi:hypothetical protein